jgi:septum formation protein
LGTADQPAAGAAATLILGSSSPRRRELLRQVGVVFRICVFPVDERVLPGEAPADYVLRVARDKALEVIRQDASDLPVLAADTAVAIDGEILGKPDGPVEAAAMLARLSGRTHEVFSAVALATRGGGLDDRLSVSRVSFAELDATWIARYVDTGDPLDKAGAYGVQGRAAEKISRLEGSFSGVMGLPLFETCELLRDSEVLS